MKKKENKQKNKEKTIPEITERIITILLYVFYSPIILLIFYIISLNYNAKILNSHIKYVFTLYLISIFLIVLFSLPIKISSETKILILIIILSMLYLYGFIIGILYKKPWPYNK